MQETSERTPVPDAQRHRPESDTPPLPRNSAAAARPQPEGLSQEELRRIVTDLLG